MPLVLASRGGEPHAKTSSCAQICIALIVINVEQSFVSGGLVECCSILQLLLLRSLIVQNSSKHTAQDLVCHPATVESQVLELIIGLLWNDGKFVELCTDLHCSRHDLTKEHFSPVNARYDIQTQKWQCAQNSLKHTAQDLVCHPAIVESQILELIIARRQAARGNVHSACGGRAV